MQAAEEKYNKSKMVHSIMRHVAETTGQDLEQLYSQIGWPLYKLYGHAFEAFKQMVQEPEPVFAKLQVCMHLTTDACESCCSLPAACLKQLSSALLAMLSQVLIGACTRLH